MRLTIVVAGLLAAASFAVPAIAQSKTNGSAAVRGPEIHLTRVTDEAEIERRKQAAAANALQQTRLAEAEKAGKAAQDKKDQDREEKQKKWLDSLPKCVSSPNHACTISR